MLFLKFLIFLIFSFTVFLSLWLNRDIFSPSKWFVFHFTVYFFDIYLGEYSLEDHLLVFLTLIVILFIVFIDRPVSYNNEHVFYKEKLLRFKGCFFFCSLLFIPVSAQVYIIYSFGGFYSYLDIIKMRVLEFRGLGPVLLLTGFYTPVVLACFGFLLSSNNKYKDWLFFLAIFIGMISINLLSGGRGTLLAPIVSMVVIYHFLKRNINISFVILIGVILISSAALLEVLRNQISVDNNQVQLFSETGASRASFEFTKYGLISPQLIMDNPISEYEYGSTYLTVFTNFVPRKLWPEKPSTGGVILTNRYMSGVWNGASNLATGVAAEAMLNFGEIGLIILPFQFLIIYFVMLKMYKGIFKYDSGTDRRVKAVLIYAVLSMSLVGFISGEFTNIMMRVLINLFFIILIFKYRSFWYGRV